MKRRSGSPFDYDLGDAADIRRERRVTTAWIPVSIGLIASGILIAVTIINEFASGIPDLQSGSSAWESDQPFPMIMLPSWLTIPVGCLPLLCTVLIWRNVDERHGPLLSNTLVLFGTVFLLLPLVLAATYSEPSPFMNGNVPFGWHWIGSIVVAIAILAMIVRRVTLGRTTVPQREIDPFAAERIAIGRKAKTNRKVRETLDERIAEINAREAAAKSAAENAPAPKAD